MKKAVVSISLACMLLLSVVFASASLAAGMTLSSQSVNDGKLATVCAYSLHTSPVGANKSPQLTWTPVDGASCYAILMVDSTKQGNGFIHWAATNIGDTSLPLGADDAMPYLRFYNSFGNMGYGGPAAPNLTGTHTYIIYVFALRMPVNPTFNGPFSTADKAIDAFQTALGEFNIITFSLMRATYTYGDNTPLPQAAPPAPAAPANSDQVALPAPPENQPYANTRVVSKAFKADGKTYKAGLVVELTAQSRDGKSFYFVHNDVTVKVSAKNLASGMVTKLSGLPKKLSLRVGKEFAFSKIKVSGYVIDKALTFSSADETVAAVVERGGAYYLAGVSAGTTVVTVTPKYGNTFTFTLTVK